MIDSHVILSKQSYSQSPNPIWRIDPTIHSTSYKYVNVFFFHYTFLSCIENMNCLYKDTIFYEYFLTFIYLYYGDGDIYRRAVQKRRVC